MEVIYKFKLALKVQQSVQFPSWPVPLSVQVQGDDICLWAKVRTDGLPDTRRIYIYGTGSELMNPHQQYLGTVQQPPFVWHVFMETK